MVGDISSPRAINAGGSYSVVQMVVKGHGDVEWAGAATRVAKNIGVATRPDVQAIVDDANAQTAVLRNQVIGYAGAVRHHAGAVRGCSSRRWATSSPTRCALKYPGVDAAYTNSGGLRADLVCAPRRRRRGAVRDHVG